MSEIIYHGRSVVFDEIRLNGRDGAISAYKSDEEFSDEDEFAIFKDALTAWAFIDTLSEWLTDKGLERVPERRIVGSES